MASSLRASLLPVIDAARSIPGALGLRQYAVTVRVNTWTGPLVGQGTETTADTPIRVGGQNPKVEQVTQRQIIMSGGLYQDQDLVVGPLTPPFPGGGVATTVFDPASVAPNVEVLFIVKGPGAASGALYKLVEQNVAANLHFTLVLRRTGETDA